MNTRERKRLVDRELNKVLKEYAKAVDQFIKYVFFSNADYIRLYTYFHSGWQKRAKFINNNFKLKAIKADEKWFYDDFHPEEKPFAVNCKIFNWIRNTK